ncbi:MAG: PadR family transcriptional regulator [Bryobacteraceae bacterium]
MKKRQRRPSEQALQVAGCLLSDSGGWHYGYSLSQKTGLPSGTLYPILMRLAENGFLETKWVDPEREGRPPRHLYRLSAQGVRWAREAMQARAMPASELRPAQEGAR